MSKILIVDDDFSMKLVLERMITAIGYDVAGAAKNGVQAVKMAQDLNPDLILMDILMPGAMDGIDAAEKIKQESDIPIIFITGFDDPEYVERAKKVEPFGYVMKPFQESEISAAVKIALHKRETELKLKQANHELKKEIEARKKIEMALRKSEEKYRFLTEKMVDIVWTTDRNFRTTHVSPSVEKVLGFTTKERCQQSIAETVTPESLRKIQQTFMEELQKDKEDGADLDRSIMIELEYLRKDGTSLWMENSVKAIRDPKNEIVGLIGVSRNIEDRKRTEMQRQKLEAQFRQIQKMESISTLTGGIAHDYNNLLSVILGNLSLAMEEVKFRGDVADFLDDAIRASLKTRDLTHELMALSRGGSPAKILGSIKELTQVASEVTLADSAIFLKTSIAKDLWPVSYDPFQMGTVFRNIVTNAVEAMPHGGTLSIMAENLAVNDGDSGSGLLLKPGDYVRISIQDQGAGISKEDLENVFDPYFSTKEMGVQKGMGLGLATAYAIVRKHGGHLAIQSSPGAGTAVNIYLPVESRPTDKDITIAAKGAFVSSAKRILVMDDEEMLRKLVRQMLERMGYAVETVKNGVEAIEAYKRQQDSNDPFDAVILDLTIKRGMGGEQTIEELLKIDPHIKAIVSSGYYDDPVMSEFEKYGFASAMAKPYEKKNMKEALEKLFGGH